MSAGDFITRSEFNHDRQNMRDRLSKIESRQDKTEARQNEHAAELKQLKDLIITGFHDVRNDVRGLKSLKRYFIEGIAVGAGVSYALYQAIHAALTVHP